jgi:hypothetical protein
MSYALEMLTADLTDAQLAALAFASPFLALAVVFAAGIWAVRT